MRRSRPALLAAVATALVAILTGCDSGSGQGIDPGDRVSAFVERVVDGDTAVMRIEGDSVYVRYIGIDTPESVKPDSPVECLGPESSDFNAEQVEGRNVELEFDRELYDPYDRLLAYVRIDGRMVNAELVRRGLAETLTIPPNERYAERFSALERAAIDDSRGLWGAC